MKVLHITPHLGGGVGKALSELSAASTPDIKRTFLLLETPRDRRYADLIEQTGATVVFAKNIAHVAEMAKEADIVQFEFWNHPRIYELLATCPFPSIRSLFWCHISGLFAPFIAPGLLTSARRFVFTSPCSFQSPALANLTEEHRSRLLSIGSGYGFSEPLQYGKVPGSVPKVGYLGTVDFVKMHPDFFNIIDAVEISDFEVSVWGGFNPDGEVAKAHDRMRHPERVKLLGHCADPAAALAPLDIFLYPLHPEHYGTAENALLEAMSLGVAPLVLANPAEQAIVEHDKTGFVAKDPKDCSKQLSELLRDIGRVRAVGANAAEYIRENHTPLRSATQFGALYENVLSEPKTKPDFVSAVGNTRKIGFSRPNRKRGQQSGSRPIFQPQREVFSIFWTVSLKTQICCKFRNR